MIIVTLLRKAQAAGRWLAAKLGPYWRWLALAFGVLVLWRWRPPRQRATPLDHDRKLREAEQLACEQAARAEAELDERLDAIAAAHAASVGKGTDAIRAESERVLPSPRRLNDYLRLVSDKTRQDGKGQ